LEAHAREVAPGPRQAGDESFPHPGSAVPVITIGIVRVACWAARIAVGPAATTTSTGSRTKSAANSGSRSGFPSAHRHSIAMDCPSTQPSSWSPGQNPSKKAPRSAGDVDASTPIRGTLPRGCALAKSGATRMARARVRMRPRTLRRMVESSNIYGRSLTVSRGVHPRVDPGEIGVLAVKETGDSVHQYGIGGDRT